MILPRRRTALLAVPAAVLALGLTACGNKTDRHLHSLSEATYIDVGPLEYQVQISRELNPRDVEDRAYFQGVSAADLQLAQDQVWFGVFVRITNPSDRTEPTATRFEIEDTRGNVYRPVPAAPSNSLVYQPTRVVPDGVDPQEGSIAADGPTEGHVLLFKVTLDTLEDRPLTLRIHGPQAPFPVGTVDLDV